MKKSVGADPTVILRPGRPKSLLSSAIEQILRCAQDDIEM